ncbi:MAG: hypothetical protein GY953_21915, partial [bacterium]|nr:hypothetical protein [bacterium]
MKFTIKSTAAAITCSLLGSAPLFAQAEEAPPAPDMPSPPAQQEVVQGALHSVVRVNATRQGYNFYQPW